MTESQQPHIRCRLFGYGATIFLSSALLLVLEILAGRLIAPYVGVSLYTWTSIIGVILAGLSLGNWLGGHWADRGGDARAVGVTLGLGGLYCILALWLIGPLGHLVQEREMSLLSASFLLAALLFGLPALLIGVVTPLLTTLALRLDSRTGRIVGRMHALAAIGSILGTFAAGYWLIQAIGTRLLLFSVGLALMLLAAPFLRATAARGRHLALILVALGASATLVGPGMARICDRESAYFCLRVVDHSQDAPFGEARGLVLDHLLHGINHATTPELLIAPYVQALDELVHAHFGARYAAGLDWLFAGGGAYSQPRAVRALSPRSRVTVAELDPAVTAIAQERLFVTTSGMRILHQDARLALQQRTDRYDVIIGDVFHDLAVPYHLATREFATLVRDRLRDGGLYTLNLVDAFPDPRLLKATVKTLRTVFAHVHVWMEGPPDAARVTFVITASDQDRLPTTVSARTGMPRAWHQVTDLVDEVGIPLARLPVLTDDYAPVERLVAPLLIGAND